jgi:hypothetical protein
MNYARQRGYAEVIEKLQMLAKRFGTRFTPHEAWQKLPR